MKLSRIQTLPERGLGLDTETWAMSFDERVPPLVCGSASWLDADTLGGVLLDKWGTLELFAQALEDPEQIIVGANIAFDLAVIARELSELDIDVYPALYRAFEDHRIYDLQIAEALHAIAQGHLGKDPRTGGPLMNPETGRRGRYSLSTCVDLVLGRTDAKENDEWRLRYKELADIPIEQWPKTAREYPVDDARNTLEVALAQCGFIPKSSIEHDFDEHGQCRDCGARTLGASCRVRRRHRNLHDVANQTWTAFAMHVGAARGFRVNQSSVDIIERHRLHTRDQHLKPFVEIGLVRDDGSENRSELKRRVALAYGADGTCSVCVGTGKVPSRAAKPVRCPACKGRCQPWKAGGKIKEPTVDWCDTCQNTAQVPNPKPPMVICHEMASDGETQLKTCDGTGLVLTEGVPRSDKEGIAYGRDVLHESGDETLMSYGDFQEDAKDLNVYVPYLRTARVCCECGQPGTDKYPHTEKCVAKHTLQEHQYTYRDVVLTLRPNVVLETGRTSYDGVIQLFKRQPGKVDKDKDSPFYDKYIPSLRECVEARPGFVLASVDYDSGELVTHAQSCIWLVGYSRLAEALKKKLKPHNALGATMIGLTYEEFDKRMKGEDLVQKLFCKNARQAAKPPNFGYPGGMGAVKLVLQQRKQGPDTPHPSGPQMIEDDAGNPVRGYKGLRFCLLMDNAEACGIRKLREWKGRRIPPTCAACIQCAVRLKEIWLKQWPENKKYFDIVQDCVQNGMYIDGDALRRWPHLAEVFRPNSRLAPGEIMQHVSGRIRQVATSDTESPFCSAANGFFQGLLGDLAKSAVRRISRECYDRSYRVPDFAHENSRKSRYGGGQSPLYGSHLIVFQHDEIIPELIEDQAHDAAMRLSEVMIEEMMWYCPDLAPAAKAPPALMRKWYKGAEPKYAISGKDEPANENDKLVPWEPKIAA